MKRMKKFVSVGYGAVVAFLAFASSSFAAIDFSPVQALILTAVADVVAGGLILLGAYAGYWGIRKVMSLFSGESSQSEEDYKYENRSEGRLPF